MTLLLTDEQCRALEKALAYQRLQADLILAPDFPHFAGKTYPLGRCKEIRDKVFELWCEALKAPHEAAFQPIRDYLQQGGTLTKVWGSLRDEYFQNAMVVGDWYIDTANDTVNPNKPRVEIRPLGTSGFRPITSFEQFIAIARSYWEVEIYRNDVVPALAPFLPLLCVNAQGASWLAAANDDMFALATQSGFELSERVLRELPPVPEHLMRRWHQKLAGLGVDSPFYVHPGDPVSYCQQYREAGKHHSLTFRDQAVRAFMPLANGG
ncbi:hypothetical protein [Photobacterium sp. TY1-4]|uniref:hypothetical protein n=1 Tax=Photobacterium sp. TY1-4 TaxID=2899122 RepID=UPI0021BE7918|nr:hypothetical protein [Photobacterium sp. TY1-4]UXI02986.1 hypothetical protein NH461_21300 [Photobacterium sp. TY1-4]